MTSVSLAAHAERADGLLAGGARRRGRYHWSSQRGWERTWRAEAELEATPLALNDAACPCSRRRGHPGPGETTPEVRGIVGLRFSEPLR
jgi:hypothetical protein